MGGDDEIWNVISRHHNVWKNQPRRKNAIRGILPQRNKLRQQFKKFYSNFKEFLNFCINNSENIRDKNDGEFENLKKQFVFFKNKLCQELNRFNDNVKNFEGEQHFSVFDGY